MIGKVQSTIHQFLQQLALTEDERTERLALSRKILNAFVPIVLSTILLSGVLTGNWNNVVLATTCAILASAVVYFSISHGWYYGTIFLINIAIFIIVFLIALNSRPPHIEIVYVLMSPLVASIFLSASMTGLMGVLAIIVIAVFAIWMTPSMPSGIAVDLVGFVTICTTFIVAVGYRRRQFENTRNEFLLQQERLKMMQFMVSSISHDFRTPLSIIHNNLYLLERDPSPDKASTRIEKIRHQANHLEQMVDDNLTLSRMEIAEKRQHPFDLVPIVQETVEQFQIVADERKIKLSVSQIEAQAIITGDANLWERVLTNLIQNALNYSDADGTTIVSLVQQADDYVICVKDSGMGIPPDKIKHIFDPFYRVDPSRRPATGGTGLGLAIVKKVVDDHQATITVDSIVGKGTEFIITIPHHQANAT
ncbi:MAG: HAMP domain-containing sensor histidine kinase [Chloroflexota bacterium]